MLKLRESRKVIFYFFPLGRIEFQVGIGIILESKSLLLESPYPILKGFVVYLTMEESKFRFDQSGKVKLEFPDFFDKSSRLKFLSAIIIIPRVLRIVYNIL